MINHKHIAVIGAGSWGTALVKVVLENVNTVTWYMRSKKNLRHIQLHKHNPSYLSSVTLDTSRINLTNNIEEAVNKADILIFAVPSAFLPQALAGLKSNLSNKIIISGIKGLVPEYRLTVSAFFRHQYHVPLEQIAVASGPSHSEEISMEKLSFIAVAAQKQELASDVAELITTRYFKPQLANDMLGVEYAAVMKNIYALASGITKGLGYGDNYQAAFISKATCEIENFLKHIVPENRDIHDMQYLGDLLVTAYSKFSRNRIFGMMLGQGYSVNSVRLEMKMIAEGYFTTKSIHEIAGEHQLNLPILDTVYRILYNDEEADGAIKSLSKNLLIC